MPPPGPPLPGPKPPSQRGEPSAPDNHTRAHKTRTRDLAACWVFFTSRRKEALPCTILTSIFIPPVPPPWEGDMPSWGWAADYGLRHCLFHPGGLGDLSHLQPALCGELADPPYGGGEATICLHVVLILLQILILRRNYDPIQLMTAGGGGVWVYRPWGVGGPGTAGAQLWGAVALLPHQGVVLVAVGVALEVIAGVVTLAGEGFILAVCQVTAIPFGNMKVGFDLTLVAISVVLSLGFLHGLYGVREGTVAAWSWWGLPPRSFSPCSSAAWKRSCRNAGQQGRDLLCNLGKGKERCRGNGMGPQGLFHPYHVIPPVKFISHLMKLPPPKCTPSAGESGRWPG